MMEQLSDEELDHGAEEDSDKEDQDLDKMFGAWLGELDKLTQSLDTDKPMEPVKRSPLRQDTNIANFSYRFSMYNINEALNQGETVDLDALMADLCSIEQELSSIGSQSANSMSIKRFATDGKTAQKPPGGSRVAAKHSSMKGLSSSSRVTKPSHAIFSLDDITAQLEKASLSMDEAAQQPVMEDSKPVVATQHRRTASAGTVSDAEVRSISNSSRSSITSAASSMDSLDIDKVTRPQELDLTQQGQPVSECIVSMEHSSKQARRHIDFSEEEAELAPHSYLDRETSLLLRNIAGKPTHLLTKEEQAAKLKAEKIRVALEKIKEAQVKKLVIRVHMSDDSSKTMMVDERQTVRQVLDNLMDKSHCGFSLDWSLVETISELQMERIFEDHENLVENLLNWTRDSQNKLMFVERIEKYALFKNPQNYLLGKRETSEMADRNKEVLLEVSRDLVCFLQLDHVNVYYGQDYRNKYKAPTDYCLVLKHPQIQKKSQYIKYLCCDDIRTLHQWVNGIRIAKYGKQLYVNYQEALKRTESAYDWTSLSSSSIKSGSSSSSLPESQSNHSNQSDSGLSDTQTGHVRSQSIVSSIFSEAWKRGTQLEESGRISARMDSMNRPFTSLAPPFTLAFPPPPSPSPLVVSPTPDKTAGSPVKKAGKTSSPGGKKPPPTPQRNSSIKSNSSAEYHESKRPSVDSLVSKFAHPPEPSGSPAKESPTPPAAPPKPGKLSLPIALQQAGISAKAPAVGGPGKGTIEEFPSPPSDSDFPPPPPEIDLPLPPVEIPAVFSGSTSPKVAVVNPQPQPWSKSSVKKAPPPTRPKRNDSTRLTQAEIAESQVTAAAPQVPTSPKSGLSVQPGFLADLNRTLQRKSITRHGSLSSARISRAEPTATMDDMALPPPPPELLTDKQKTSNFGGSHISGYATLRRGPPPAPPKRDQNTKLSRDW
ncbi:hypothetical protein JD844_023213 [Phrynosoma platyrhinos]|uniref:Ras-associating domain-containing protein n=1 Tax=Phrynosoma platyrhinos TaxID=52577 RepID=A0ABQ7SWH5_PHRPL|nr:hypothetical protein JD844_023213 [Phrynosoma platyrhinos]